MKVVTLISRAFGSTKSAAGTTCVQGSLAISARKGSHDVLFVVGEWAVAYLKDVKVAGSAGLGGEAAIRCKSDRDSTTNRTGTG